MRLSDLPEPCAFPPCLKFHESPPSIQEGALQSRRSRYETATSPTSMVIPMFSLSMLSLWDDRAVCLRVCLWGGCAYECISHMPTCRNQRGTSSVYLHSPLPFYLETGSLTKL